MMRVVFALLRRLKTLFVMTGIIGVVFCLFGWREAQRDPVVRKHSVSVPNWPQGTPPITLLLVSDIHVSRPDMTVRRLEHIVTQLNAVHADAILIAGDLVSDKMLSWKVESGPALAPLGKLSAPLGVYTVLGNHDHERGVGEMRRAIRQAGIRLLKDDAVQLGPIILGGIDDSVTDHSDLEGTLFKMNALGLSPKVMLSHGTSSREFLPSNVSLLLTGHEHCGQIVLPLPFWPKHHCGVERWGSLTMISGAGLGTSILPLRLNAPPDVWLVTVGP